MTRDAQLVADQLGLLLQRRVRRTLHANVIRGVHRAVDESTYPVLSGIERFGECTAATLGAELGIDRALVSRKAAELTRAGLLITRTDPDDRRLTLLALSAAGSRVIEQLRRRLVSSVDDVLRDWPASERHRFAQSFARFVNAIGDDHADADRVQARTGIS